MMYRWWQPGGTQMAGIGAILFLVCLGSSELSRARAADTSAGEMLHQHREQIKARLKIFNDSFPETQFVHLEGGDHWHGEMIALVAALTPNAKPLDYEFPPALHEQMMAVTLDRLVIMLRRNIISATSFRVPRDALLERPNVCVITLNPEHVITDDREATRHMLGLDTKEFAKVHPARYLDHLAHLDFAIDHEVFHCLESIYSGGVPATHREYDSQYHLFRRESLADAFALVMHIRSQGARTAYARNITHVRALCLCTGSPDHCTSATMLEFLALEPGSLAALSLREVMALVHRIGDPTLMSGRDYLREQAAVLQAAESLGYASIQYGEEWRDLTVQKADSALVKRIVARHRYYYGQLFTASVVSFRKPVAPAPPGQ